MNYHNEIDPFAAAWTRNLIAEGLIAPGIVDERDIRDVRPDDLRGFIQCHFFAGIGGWPLALRLAGWPDDRPVWTGSCPCQPFSTAGKNKGAADARHLWPHWFPLIRECRPAVVFGEQVPNAIAHGWLDAVFDDLEGARYACGAGIAPAAGAGAPHIRDRLWFVANATREFVDRRGPRGTGRGEPADSRPDVADPFGYARDERRVDHAGEGPRGGVGADVADAEHGGRQGWVENRRGSDATLSPGWWAAEPDVGRVAHGVPGRVGRLRAYGNAIVPQVAAEFIGAYLDAEADAQHLRLGIFS